MDKFRAQSVKGQEQLKKAKEEHNLLQVTMETRINELEARLQQQVTN